MYTLECRNLALELRGRQHKDATASFVSVKIGETEDDILNFINHLNDSLKIEIDRIITVSLGRREQFNHPWKQGLEVRTVSHAVGQHVPHQTLVFANHRRIALIFCISSYYIPLINIVYGFLHISVVIRSHFLFLVSPFLGITIQFFVSINVSAWLETHP